LRVLGDSLNREYFRMFRQVPWMLRLRLASRHGGVPPDARRILIVNNALIGEFLTALPAVRHLMDQTGAEVDVVVSPPLAPLARRMIGVRHVFAERSVYQRETEKGEPLEQHFGDYDWVLVLQLSRETYETLRSVGYARIKVALGAYLRYALEVATHLTTKRHVRQLEDGLFDVVGLARTRKVEFDEVFGFRAEDHERLVALRLPEDTTSRRVVVHTGSGWPRKLWRNERWAELLARINALGRFQFLFIGATEREAADAHDIASQLSFEVHSIVGRADLRDLALAMKRSHFFVGVDSGPRHLAHLLNLPSVCLLGPGPKIYSPVGRHAVIVDRSQCRCTSLLCYRRERCMDRIGVDDVAGAFEKLAQAAC
jgi:ADP-heptose:LPS heptosyltransferase